MLKCGKIIGDLINLSAFFQYPSIKLLVKAYFKRKHVQLSEWVCDTIVWEQSCPPIPYGETILELSSQPQNKIQPQNFLSSRVYRMSLIPKWILWVWQGGNLWYRSKGTKWLNDDCLEALQNKQLQPQTLLNDIASPLVTLHRQLRVAHPFNSIHSDR